MNDLEEKTEDKQRSKTPEERIDGLLQAFELFCAETSRLEVAYGKLKAEFCSINTELEETNEALKQKLVELKRLTQYLDNILNHISEGLLFIDKNGTITTFNPAAEVILNSKKELVIGHPFGQVFNDTLFGFSIKEALFKNSAPSFVRLTLSGNSNQDEKLVEIETKFLTSGLTPNTDDSETEGLMVSLRDTTELNRLAIAAKRSDRMQQLGEMASVVAHEIRNPLGGIKGFASLLKRDLAAQPEQEKMAAYIVEGTDKLNELVSQILDFTRPVAPQFTRFAVATLISETQKLVELNSQISPQPQFCVKITPSDLQATMDYQKMQRVVLNLFINAAQAMPKGGKITVDCHMKEDNLILKVKDEGTGISKENLDKLFSPFFTTKQQGNGFGLAESYKVILAHRGQIDATSELGHGTTFTIILPQKALHDDT